MKYLVILFMLAGCGKGAGELWQEEFDSQQLTETEADSYLGKCFKHGSPRHYSTVVIEESAGQFVMCYFNDYCDFRNKNKCVTSKECNGWTRKTAIKYILNKRGYTKETECPK